MSLMNDSMGFLPLYCWQRPNGITGLLSGTYLDRWGLLLFGRGVVGAVSVCLAGSHWSLDSSIGKNSVTKET